MALELFQIEVGMMLNFCTLFVDVDARECAVVDPAFEVDRVMRVVTERGLRVVAILITHTHHDHIDGVEELARATGAPAYVGGGELAALRRAAPTATLRPIADGETVAVGGAQVTALATPGHTVDARSYQSDGAVATGDTLFVGGCGRTDFPGGDPGTLHRSLLRLAALPEQTRVYPGHDYGQTPTSTVAWERAHNPYLRCAGEAEFVALRTGKSAPRPTRGPR